MAFNKLKALQEGEKLVSQGKISGAIRQYLQIIEKDPEEHNLYNTVGDLYVRDKNIPEALKCFRTLADQYVKDGFTLKAIAILKKVAKLEPASPEPLVRLGGLYQVQGLTREARELYFLAVDLFKKKSRYDEALSTLRMVVRLDPDNTTARARVAMFCEQTGRQEEAAQAYLETAEAALRRSDLTTAGSALKKAAALEGENPRARLLQARLAFAQQQLDVVEKILAAEPPLTDYPAARQLLFDTYMASNRLEAAEKLVATLFRANPADLKPIHLYLDRCLERGDADAALRPLAEIAEPLQEQKELTPVMEGLRQIWAKFPQHLPTLELICQICKRTSDEFALPEILEALGQAYDQAGDLEKAESVFHTLLQREPGNQHYRSLFNQLRTKQGKEVAVPLPAEPPPGDVTSLRADAAAIPEGDSTPSTPAPVEDRTRLALIAEALENSDLFSRYGLVDKAVAELENVLVTYPDVVEIHQRILEVCHRTRPERAAEASAALARLVVEKGESESLATFDQLPALSTPPEEPLTRSAEVAATGEPQAGFPEVPATKAESVPEFAPLSVEETAPARPDEAVTAANETPLEPAPTREAAETLAAPPSPAPEFAEIDLSGDLETLAVAAGLPTAAPPAPPPPNLESIRQEIEFYLANGFDEEARKILAEAEVMLPGNLELAELHRRVEEALKPAAPEGFPPPSTLDTPESVLAPPDVAPETSEFASAEPPAEVAEAPTPPTFTAPEISEAPELPIPTSTEERELPGPFAGTPPPASSALPLSSAPEPAVTEPLAPPAPMVGNKDLLGDLASDFDSTMEGFEGITPPPAPSPVRADAAEDDSASLLSGLLEEINEPGGQAADDPETHYNLGVAFREMGLIDEAIGEFQKVVRQAQKGQFPPNFLQSCSLLGTCFLEKKMPIIAAKWYIRAQQTPGLDAETTLALHYELGLAYELAGDFRRALENFTEVYSQNIDHRDVAEKIRVLQQKVS
jgi:tetratricopeptide (TPR) repeat protein